MSSDNRMLLLSLRPVYAELILAGTKTIELRRVRPRAAPGTAVLVYASSPRRQLVGTCVVSGVHTAPPDEIWGLHAASVGVTRDQFDSYFAGATRAVAIRVSHPKRLKSPVPLDGLRSALADFQPPQSFRYISRADAAALIGPRRVAEVCRLFTDAKPTLPFASSSVA